MPKPVRQRENEIVMSVDRDAGVIDLSVYAHHSKKRHTELVGSAKLRMADLPQVLRLLTERLRIEDRAVKAGRVAKSWKRKAKIAWAI
jgi:hypothetical protein